MTVTEEVIRCLLDRAGAAAKLSGFREVQPMRLIHGDLTEDNLRLSGNKLWLFDWDNIRLLQTGPFDLAFSLVRLARPDRMHTSLTLTSDDIQAARKLVQKFAEGCRKGTLPSELDMALALEEVRFEFCLRMLEYFEIISAVPSWRPESAYIARCNPGRPRQLLRELFPDQTVLP